MDRFFRTLLLIRAAQRLAIDGDDLGGRFGQRRDPGNEAALKCGGIERGENIAQRVMRRHTVGEGAKPPQQVELFTAESRDVGKAIGSGEHREQTQ